jgi:molybdopterin-guanine dinucleotide biosynthesis protein B
VTVLHREDLPAIVSVVAKSGTGKTTLLEALIPHLKAHGLRVGLLKHHSHLSSFDTPGKDTHRLAEAGADMVVGASPVQVATFRRTPGSADLDAVIAQHLADADLVLTEGYKRGPYPKIEVHRSARSDELLCSPDEMLALVTDRTWPIPVPQFSLDDAAGLAGHLLDWHSAPVKHGYS